MSECRICFGNEADRLLRPCLCRGSIMFFHQYCLEKWLKRKYPANYHFLLKNPKEGNTGLRCELCKYEYKGKVTYLTINQIAKRIKSSNATYLLLMNIPIIIYLIYKCNDFLRHICWLLYQHICYIKEKKPLSSKAKKIAAIFPKLCMKIISMSVFGATLPLIGLNTFKLFLKLVSEFKIIKFEDHIY